MKISIVVRIKNDIPDPAGEAIRQLLLEAGSSDLRSIRVGKFVELDFDGGDDTTATERVKRLCQEVLVNDATEEYSFKIED